MPEFASADTIFGGPARRERIVEQWFRSSSRVERVQSSVSFRVADNPSAFLWVDPFIVYIEPAPRRRRSPAQILDLLRLVSSPFEGASVADIYVTFAMHGRPAMYGELMPVLHSADDLLPVLYHLHGSIERYQHPAHHFANPSRWMYLAGTHDWKEPDEPDDFQEVDIYLGGNGGGRGQSAMDNVRAALIDPRWEFRTVEGIARDTGLAEVEVRLVLQLLGNEVRRPLSPDSEDRELYTLASRRPSLKERYNRFRSQIATW